MDEIEYRKWPFLVRVNGRTEVVYESPPAQPYPKCDTPIEERQSPYYCARRSGHKPDCEGCSFEHGVPHYEPGTGFDGTFDPCHRWEEV